MVFADLHLRVVRLGLNIDTLVVCQEQDRYEMSRVV